MLQIILIQDCAFVSFQICFYLHGKQLYFDTLYVSSVVLLRVGGAGIVFVEYNGGELQKHKTGKVSWRWGLYECSLSGERRNNRSKWYTYTQRAMACGMRSFAQKETIPKKMIYF